MSTQQLAKSNTVFQNALLELPVLKHFDQSSIITNSDKVPLKGGAKGIFSLMSLLTFAGLGVGAYFTFTYVLPQVFMMLGAIAAYAIGGVAVILLALSAPAIWKKLKRVARNMHKRVIKEEPFEEFVEKRKLMVENQRKAIEARVNISQLQLEMEGDALTAEQEATKQQTRLTTLRSFVTALKNQIEKIQAEKGVDSDEYVETQKKYMTKLADSNRMTHTFNQNINLVRKYGTRAAAMKSFVRKMELAETNTAIVLADYDATIDMLKKEAAFTQKTAQATNAARSALGFDKSWKFDYAMDVVMNTISANIAATASNLRDIDNLTSHLNFDDEESFENLNMLADNINSGVLSIPKASDYAKSTYKLTTQDRLSSGGISELAKP